MREKTDILSMVDDSERELLLSEVQYFIEHIEEEINAALRWRELDQAAEAVTAALFRDKQRIQLLRVILQELVTLSRSLPTAEGGPSEVTERFLRFRQAVASYIGCLQNDELIRAIVSEYQRFGPLQDPTRQDIEKKIADICRELNGMVQQARSADASGYLQLLAALHKQCLFWFEIRGFNFRQIRKSDVYIFKLTDFMLKRQRRQTTPDA